MAVWVNIIRHNLGSNVNRDYTKRAAKACGVATPLYGTLTEAIEANRAAQNKCNCSKEISHLPRTSHLSQCLSRATKYRDKTRYRSIKQIFWSEHTREAYGK